MLYVVENELGLSVSTSNFSGAEEMDDVAAAAAVSGFEEAQETAARNHGDSVFAEDKKARAAVLSNLAKAKTVAEVKASVLALHNLGTSNQEEGEPVRKRSRRE